MIRGFLGPMPSTDIVAEQCLPTPYLAARNIEYIGGAVPERDAPVTSNP